MAMALNPILPLSTGHMALVLTAGMLDGLVELETGPVVIKAISSKARYQKSQHTEIRKGTRHTIIVHGEQPQLVIRVLDQNGVITEYT